MVIRLEISGGIAAPITSSTLTVDSARLPAEHAKAIEELARQIVKEPPPQISSKLRDARYYDLSIKDESRDYSIAAADGAMTDGLSRLVKLIKLHGMRTP